MSLLLALTGGGAPTNYQITASAGAYTVSGQSASILKSKVVTAVAGSYAVSGQSANLLKSKLVTALTGAYSVSGQAASITYAPASGAYTITANSGAYVVSGKDAIITKTSNTQAQQNSGGWFPNTRRKTKKEVYRERVKLGIIKEVIEETAEKVVSDNISANIVDTQEKITHNRPDVADLVAKLMVELRVSVKSPDYTRAIQLALLANKRKVQEDEDEILMLLM